MANPVDNRNVGDSSGILIPAADKRRRQSMMLLSESAKSRRSMALSLIHI